MLFSSCVHRSLEVCPYDSGKESSTLILDLDADPDHRQNLITSKLSQV